MRYRLELILSLLAFTSIIACTEKPITSPEEETEYKDLSEAGISNSYLLDGEGYYSLDASVRGTGKAPGGLALDVKIEPKSAVLLWQSTKQMITELSLEDGRILFKTSGKAGNALVAACDKNGSVLWSWHLWQSAEKIEEIPSADPSVMMMSMNLGALSSKAARAESLGLLYQWGRKDPFPGAPVTNGGTLSTVGVPVYDMDGNAVRINSSSMNDLFANTLEYSIMYPQTCLSCNAQYSSFPNWIASGKGETAAFWGNANGAEADAQGRYPKGEKGFFDPCPQGWRVPYIGAFKGITSTRNFIFAQGDAFGDLSWSEVYVPNVGFGGVDIDGDGKVNLNDYKDGWYFNFGGKDSYFPATTRYDGSYAMLMGTMVGLWGNYWYNAPDKAEGGARAAALTFQIKAYGSQSYTLTASEFSNGARADAYAIRCIKID